MANTVWMLGHVNQRMLNNRTGEFMNIEDAVEHLKGIAEYEGTEVGEAWEKMISLWESYQSYISDELYKALEKEIITEATNAKEQFVLKEEETTYTVKTKTLDRK
jgi:hypothetical protein